MKFRFASIQLILDLKDFRDIRIEINSKNGLTFSELVNHPVKVITNALSVRGQIHPDSESFYTYIYQIITKSIAYTN